MTEEEPAADPSVNDRSPATVRTELGRFAELSALVGFAVVSPVLGAFGESPETFVGVGAGPGEVVRFALIVTFVPLVAIGLFAAATRALGARVRRVVQYGLVGLLAGIVATTVARQFGAGSVVRFAAAGIGGAAVVWIYRTWRPGQMFLRYASPAPVFFLLVFTLASPVAGVINPSDVSIDQSSASDAPPVVVIVLDELPTASLTAGGRIDADLFPNIARLADQSTWYRNNTTVGSRTAIALPAIVTGRYPGTGEEVPANVEDYPDNLLTFLAETHEVHATEWATGFCPTSVCNEGNVALDETAKGLLRADVGDRPGAVDSLLDEARTLWWDQAWPGAEEQPATYEVAGVRDPGESAGPGLEFLSGLQEPTGDRPVFDYLHAPLPHQPWSLLPSGDTYQAPNPPVGTELTGWSADDLGAQLGQAGAVRHRLQMQWTDRLLGAIIDRLEELERWDDALVVLTADHGVSFDPGMALRLLLPENQDEIAWTPLFVKRPGQDTASVDDGNAMTVDIVPTVADVVDRDVPWELDGQSLLDGTRADDRKISEAVEADQFATKLAANRVELDGDGLAKINATPVPEDPDDPIRIWRAGRHGALLGRQVDDIGPCPSGEELTARYQPPADWDSYMAGTLDPGRPLPLWHEATIDDGDHHDVALAVDGTVVAWAPARPFDGAAPVGLLLTQPLLDTSPGDPVLYEIDQDCLRPIRT